MLTICWAAKGGSGTTVYAVARALAITTPTVLVDLAGDVLPVLGLPRPDGPGVHDWLRSDAGPDRLARLEHRATDLLVTRACYLALTRAAEIDARPTGIVLVEEPGRCLRPSDIEASLGAPIVATALLDPAIARAVDSGLLVSRLPSAWRRQLRRAA